MTTDSNCHHGICYGNIYPYQDYLSGYWLDFYQTPGTILNRWSQLSWWHLSRQHMSWRHLSISSISQLLLTQFWPNFIGSVPGTIFNRCQLSRLHLSKQHISWWHLSIWLIFTRTGTPLEICRWFPQILFTLLTRVRPIDIRFSNDFFVYQIKGV